MKTVDIIVAVNNMSDETETNPNVLLFLNDAIAKINVHMNCAFPPLIADSNNTPIFSDKWQRILLIPFAVGRIKQKDSSQFEYTDAYREFYDNLDTFKQKYNVPTIYKCLVSGNEIALEDNSTYETQEDDTLASIATDKNMTTAGIINANVTLYYVEDGIPSDIYDKSPFPWYTTW